MTALIAAMAMPIFSLVGCGSAVTDPSISKASTATLPVMQGHTSYPLTVTSCGVSQVFESAPKRAVTLTSTATETMLELGLEKRMVGTA
ncbi:ABC transporter substrate-binding protein, partial [Cutibacterium acnes]